VAGQSLAANTRLHLERNMQMLDPIGIDRWRYEHALKYGMRDALACSVGRRWLVAYWSGQPSARPSRNLFASRCLRPPALLPCGSSN
jgi:hypothetical protein